MILTYRYRIKDAGSRAYLNRLAGTVNFVWNYCCEVQRECERRRVGNRSLRWPSAPDLNRLTSGCAALLEIHSDTINGICRQFVSSRDAHKRCPKWRSAKKGSLGWIPINHARAFRIDGDSIIYRKKRFHFWKSREIDGQIRNAAFGCDSRGRWYINIRIDVADDPTAGKGEVGIDPGLTTLATLSDGRKIDNPRAFKKHEQRLAAAQRARRFARAKAIQAKIANTRRHYLHEQTTKLVRENSLIVVGDVNAKAMMKTRMAKSVADASWSTFRGMLRYKALRHGATYIEADERFSSQTCSACGVIPSSRPQGIAGLRVRSWVCSDCGAVHDRDINAAINLLAGAKCRPPAVEIVEHSAKALISSMLAAD